MNNNREFGKFIRKYRLELEPPITLRSLASKVNISPTYLCKIERGDFKPPVRDVIRRIAKVLKCNEDELLALAGKIPSDIAAIIIKRPAEIAQFLRLTKELKKEQWEKLIEKLSEL